jgi:hypothetical protein
VDVTGLFGLKDATIPRRLRRRESAEDWWLVTVVVASAWLLRLSDFIGFDHRK